MKTAQEILADCLKTQYSKIPDIKDLDTYATLEKFPWIHRDTVLKVIEEYANQFKNRKTSPFF